MSCSGRVIRSKYRLTGRKASLTVIVGSPNGSTCWSTGSGARPWKVSPGRRRTGIRFAWATPAAVTMLSAPGPIDDVATITCRRSMAFPKPTAARAIPSSVLPRQVGSRSRSSNRAVPRPSTLPCPKMPNTPANRGTSLPSRSSDRWAIIQRTSACAVVSRTVFGGRCAARALPAGALAIVVAPRVPRASCPMIPKPRPATRGAPAHPNPSATRDPGSSVKFQTRFGPAMTFR